MQLRSYCALSARFISERSTSLGLRAQKPARKRRVPLKPAAPNREFLLQLKKFKRIANCSDKTDTSFKAMINSMDLNSP
jgi:hypothetical protein